MAEISKDSMASVHLKAFQVLFFLSLLVCLFPAVTWASQNAPIRTRNVDMGLTQEEKAWIKEHPVIRARVGSAPPLHFFENIPKGISVDYLNVIAARAGFEIEYVHGISWPDALKYIQAHEKIDLILTAKITEERKKVIAFTENYLFMPWVIFTRDDFGFVSGMEDLNGKTVSVERGFVMHEKLLSEFPKIKVLETETSREAIEAVATGKADAYVGNLTTTTYIIQRYNLTNVKVAAPTPFDNHNQAFAIRSDWPQLVSIINKTLETLPPEEHENIRSRWLSIRYEHGITRGDILKWVLAVVSFFLFTLTIIMFWNRRLQKEIRSHKISKDLLAENEKRYRQIFETNQAIKLVIDPADGAIIEVNGAACQFYGYSQAEFLELNIYDINTLPKDEVQEEMEKARTKDKLFFSFQHALASGELRDVEVYSGPLKFGEKVYLHSIVHDVTDREQAEKELRLSNRRLESLFQSSPVPLWEEDFTEVYGFFKQLADEGVHDIREYIDANPSFLEKCSESIKILDVNQEAIKLHDAGSREELLGNLDKIFTQKSLETFQEEIMALFEGHFHFESEGEVRTLSGEPRSIFLKMVVEKEPGESYRAFIATIDISERKQMEERLIQAEKMESIGRLAGGVAHDFNNMLSIIHGNTEIAIEDLDATSPLIPNLEEVQKAAQRSADLTRQLLAFARKQSISPKVLNLNHTIEGMLKMLRRLIGEDIDLAWRPESSLWPVEIDPSQVDQILANLCVNARDSIKGVGKVVIKTNNVRLDELFCKEHPGAVLGDYVELVVSDNGCGMDRNTLDSLFEPFFTTKELGEGTGLGLATVYGVVKQNQGFIDVSSEIDQGTAFRIYLPKCSDPFTGERQEPDQEVLQTGRETILLVEDEKAILVMTKMMLERLGYRVLAANTPNEAIRLSLAFEEEIQLLITDVVMPSMNGRELAEKLQQSFPNMKCLYISGYTDDVIAHRGILDPGLHVINKPFSKHDLSVQIRKTLDEKDR